jgi:sec-independent protein translocase protein TatB
MFDIGWSELLVIGSLALIVVGPRDLPKMLRTFGQYVGQARGMAREFQRSMEEAAREADISDMKEMRETAQQLRSLTRAPFDAKPGAKPAAAKPAAAPAAAVGQTVASAPPAPSAQPAAAEPAPSTDDKS